MRMKGKGHAEGAGLADFGSSELAISSLLHRQTQNRFCADRAGLENRLGNQTPFTDPEWFIHGDNKLVVELLGKVRNSLYRRARAILRFLHNLYFTHSVQ